MKGKINGEIINSVNALKMLNSKIVKVEKFKLPINNNERSLIVIKKNKTTNSKYPRFFTKIKKKPL